MSTDTIFALSSGAPPAAIAVVRISGPRSRDALQALAGTLPAARRATLRRLRDHDGQVLDDALVLWFPGPATASGEDLAELHLHGGRAVVHAVEQALSGIAELRRATPGEFTRRAFVNGRIDLAEAEGLADLLAAETELQRRSALAMAEGTFSATVDRWRERLLGLSGSVEAALDFSDEDDVALSEVFHVELVQLRDDMATWLQRPRAEQLKDGFRVVLAGPPNAGKSTLFNALVESEAAITAATAGTTRDVLVRSVALAGMPFSFIDTAGLREGSTDEIETIGIGRAIAELGRADLVLWLGPEEEGPAGCWEIEAQIDRTDRARKASARHRVSAESGVGLDGLRSDLLAAARTTMPKPGAVALNERQHRLLHEAVDALREAGSVEDLILLAECLRLARSAFDALVGRTTTEDMLDALFGRFCIGK
ncbi:tRNA modification GTPase MnmE [Novosphingobium marinum]|uniref:tRNA modification GTPase MnmE n=1 Tax=Novosphingobium marinum TaxID=1514948 RepID=A0A7Y9XW52_9SPHN|nr:tRNA uridine-5-carboxymethylaminomethyl(34) synthesis GTPase MnmE [Novosphingobium marinum]NYH95649.1 tRNA modification GTPase [Novosphingobium marinum]GGC28714.1 tRNA modification GTPase MnmE [Novosphingobium marinum]